MDLMVIDGKFITDIKSEPADIDSEPEENATSCINVTNIKYDENLELKYEAEEEQVEESTNAYYLESSIEKPENKFRSAQEGFAEVFEEICNRIQMIRDDYREEIIGWFSIPKFFTDVNMTKMNAELFKMITSNFKILENNEEFFESAKKYRLFVPQKGSFNASHVHNFEKCFKEVNENNAKLELINGMVKIDSEYIKDIDYSAYKEIKNIKTLIDDNGDVWKIYECNPYAAPFSKINQNSEIANVANKPGKSYPKIILKGLGSLNSIKTITNGNKFPSDISSTQNNQISNIKIKDELVDNPESIISNISIKQEINEDQPMIANLPLEITECTSQQEDTYIITEVDDVKQEPTEYDDFPHLASNFQENSRESKNNDDEDEFQYNTVNSFKSDLATRRSVSHTVVSGKSDKTKAEAALLAMHELMKIEQDKKVEREKSASGLNQIEKPKTMNVSLNVNGVRVVTKVSLPSVDPKVKKPIKSVEDECKFQCPICFIKFKTDGQLIGHKRIHDTARAKLNTADMTKNVYKEVKMRIEQIANRRSIHVLLPNYDYAFIVTNSTANKLYMKCFRQACEVKAYSTNDGKFFVKVGEQHTHGPDREVILSKIDEKKRSDLEKTEVINKSVHEAIAQQQKQKNMMEAKKSALIERIKRSQEVVNGKKVIQEVKRRKI